jgi:hypothetical protein
MNRGKVLDIENDRVLIMTDDFVFLNIKAKPKIEIGQRITFSEDDIIRPAVRLPAYAAIVAGLAAAITIVFIFLQLNMWRNDIYAYIDVDINPSVELSIDKDNRIAGVKPLNHDAQTLISGISLKNLSVSEALEKIIDRSEECGFVKRNAGNAILISASLDPDIKGNKNTVADYEEKLEDVLYSINRETEADKENNISLKVIRVRPEERKLSIKNNISMGRYIFYSKAKDNGMDLNIEEARDIDVSSIWEKLDAYSGDSKVTPTGTPLVAAKISSTPAPTTDVLTVPTEVYTPTAIYSTNTLAKPKVSPTQRKLQNTPVRYSTSIPVQAIPTHSIPTMPQFTEKPKTDGHKNLVKNPGFEEGNASYWQITNYVHWVVSTEEKYSGKYSVKLSGKGDWCSLIQQNIRLLPNTNYVYSFYGKCRKGSKVVYKVLEDFGGLPITKDYEITANDTWTKYSVTFNTGFYAKVKIYLGDGGGEAYFDDFSLTEAK